jgi:hypothetical protein
MRRAAPSPRNQAYEIKYVSIRLGDTKRPIETLGYKESICLLLTVSMTKHSKNVPCKPQKTAIVSLYAVWWRKSQRVSGGPGRTRTCNRTVMSRQL